MCSVIKNFHKIEPKPQKRNKGSYGRKRFPKDSKIDPEKSIADQFNILRVADPNRYPAFFEYLGNKYLIEIKKVKDFDKEFNKSG